MYLEDVQIEKHYRAEEARKLTNWTNYTNGTNLLGGGPDWTNLFGGAPFELIELI